MAKKGTSERLCFILLIGENDVSNLIRESAERKISDHYLVTLSLRLAAVCELSVCILLRYEMMIRVHFRTVSTQLSLRTLKPDCFYNVLKQF